MSPTVRVRMLSVLTLALLLSLSAPPASVNAQAVNETVKTTDSFAFSFFNDCTGEVVSGVVELKTTVHITQDPQGGFHAHVVDVFSGRAVGETSGIVYVGPQTDHESFNVSAGGGLNDTSTLDFRFISRGGGDNLLSSLVAHITITPDGVVTSEIERITTECVG